MQPFCMCRSLMGGGINLAQSVRGENKIEFTPTETGAFTCACDMEMPKNTITVE